MGKGDKRTRRGKIFKGSYGNSRTQKVKATSKSPTSSQSTPAAKKAPAVKKSK